MPALLLLRSGLFRLRIGSPWAEARGSASPRGVPTTRHHRHLPVFPLSIALGHHLRVVRQSNVDGPSLGWRHGLKGEGPPGPGNPFRHPESQPPKDLCPTLPIPLYVQHHPAFVLIRVPAQQQIHHKLQDAQGLSAPADEEPGVLSGDLYELRVR